MQLYKQRLGLGFTLSESNFVLVRENYFFSLWGKKFASFQKILWNDSTISVVNATDLHLKCVIFVRALITFLIFC